MVQGSKVVRCDLVPNIVDPPKTPIEEKQCRLVGLAIEVHVVQYQGVLQGIPEKGTSVVGYSGIPQIQRFIGIQFSLLKKAIPEIIRTEAIPGIEGK
jgi:hypothetical protein